MYKILQVQSHINASNTKTCSEETQYSVKIIMYRSICWCNEFVVEESTIFLVITPCSPLKVNGRFGGTYYLYLEVLSR
jgi:hypothetical protein